MPSEMHHCHLRKINTVRARDLGLCSGVVPGHRTGGFVKTGPHLGLPGPDGDISSVTALPWGDGFRPIFSKASPSSSPSDLRVAFFLPLGLSPPHWLRAPGRTHLPPGSPYMAHFHTGQLAAESPQLGVTRDLGFTLPKRTEVEEPAVKSVHELPGVATPSHPLLRSGEPVFRAEAAAAGSLPLRKSSHTAQSIALLRPAL